MMRLLSVFLLIMVSTFFFKANAAIFSATYSYGVGNLKEVFLKVTAGCGGQVEYYIGTNQNITDVEVSYDNGANYQSVVSSISNGSYYSWVLNYANASSSEVVYISFKNSGSTHFHSVDYDHLGADTYLDVDYTVTEIAPNYYSFTYTGESGSSWLTESFAYNYSFAFSFGDGSPDIEGGTISSGDPLLVNGNLIGYPYTTANPHFYCNVGEESDALTELSVSTRYYFPDADDNEWITQCYTSDVLNVELDDLCTHLAGFNVESTGPNEFYSDVTSSTTGNATLDGFIDDVSVDVNGSGYSANVSGISGPNQNTTHFINNSSYQNYSYTETVTFEEGCECQNVVYFHTGDPCHYMGPITISYQFDPQTGEYVYTLTPSVYAGGNPNPPDFAYVIIDWGDGSPLETFYPPFNITHVYDDDGYYVIHQQSYFQGWEDDPCDTYLGGENDPNNPGGVSVSTYCCENFAPESGKPYWVSAWVKEDLPAQVKTYENASLELEFNGPNATTISFYPTGDIIEGWQRIVGKFTVPDLATTMRLHLVNDNESIDVYFDDVRVHPFNASMKSYVYDPETFWLTAELDDNNYATFYEYDKEGQLIRIKKETARGIMTIQESRSSNPKRDE